MFSQSDGTQLFWKSIDKDFVQIPEKDRWIKPSRHATLQLQFNDLKQYVQQAPAESAIESGAVRGLTIDLPTPEGGFAKFRIWRVPVMHPSMEAAYPNIRTYAGRGVDNPFLILRMDHTMAGFHAMVMGGKGGSWFIDPYARQNTALYVCYFKKHFSKEKYPCLVETPSDKTEIELPETVQARTAGCGTRREYRLAVACTGEYASFHGATAGNKQPALAAIVSTVNRITGIYEKDFSVRLNLIPNDTLIIYTNGSSDPYTNGNSSAMLTQNQTTITNVIGSTNYDVGHVFGTGGGGVASLGSVCSSSAKAQGVSLHPNPTGDPFDVDYVSHELGHQFNGQHTQYNDDCNRSNSSAMEPGSASTIMGYAGVCAPDVQPNSDDYFHSRSIQQTWPFVVSGGGAACDVAVSTGNSIPTINSLTNRTIPKSTPFFLTAVASDPNGDALTYCWEQRNAWSSSTQPMPPESTNTSGPMFRSLDPVASPTRYFPNFPDLLAGVDPTWEELPSVARTLNFRVSVRDNNAAGGCVAEQDMTVTVNAGSGPFAVTMPNTNVTVLGGTTGTITWDVANTNNSPVSCASVDILISFDGGANFQDLLLSTSNDGTQTVTYPNVATTDARIMIRSVGNIFFDVNDEAFTIQFNPSAPVELQDFTVKLTEKQHAFLQWQTATEQNNKGFEVERSEDDPFNFKVLSWVDGGGNSKTTRQYAYEDKFLAPGQVYFYRLRNVDFDGKTSGYSPIRAVSTGSELQLLRLSPNPASDELAIAFYEQPEGESFQTIVTDANGKSVLSTNFTPGNALGINSLAPGLYHIRIIDEGKLYFGRFVKQ